MCKINESAEDNIDDIKAFNKYLVFYGPGEGIVGVKGIRSDAPKEAIDSFLNWYRDRNRYENGRLRPLNKALISKLVIGVKENPSD